MRLLFILMFVFVSNIAYSAQSPNGTVEVTGKSAEALFLAMKVKITQTGGAMSPIAMKTLLGGKVVCRNYTMTSKGGYVCKLSSELSPIEILRLFVKLDAPIVETNVSWRNTKIIGDLIFMSSASEEEPLNTAMPNKDDNRIFYKHPCAGVESAAKAKTCMTFWAREIFQSYEDINDAIVVSSTKATQDLLSLVLTMDGFDPQPREKIVKEAVNSSYLAVVGEYQDEMHLIYFVANTEGVMAPILVNDLNLVDLDIAGAQEILNAKSKAELTKKLTKTLFLGVDAKPSDGFQHIKEEIKYRVETELE